MALIEFKCEACGKLFEKIVYLDTDRSAITCPACGGKVSQNLSGKCYGRIGGGGGDCTGNCKTCPGCHH